MSGGGEQSQTARHPVPLSFNGESPVAAVEGGRADKGSDPVALPPAEAGNGVGCRRVFGAYPAGVAEFVDAAEHELPADLAGAGFVSARYIGELHVADDR